MSKRGFILFGVVSLALTFIVIIIPLISWSANEFSWTSRSFMSLRALNLADAGAELAVWEIAHNGAQFPAWSGINPKTLTISSFTDNTGAAAGDISVSVDNTSPGHYLVTSVGYVPNQAEEIVKKTVKVKVFPHALFNNAIFGDSLVSLSGNTLVDSYNSSFGPYNPITAGSNADVGTNAAVTRSENAVIKGDVFIGPDGTVSGINLPYVTGETYYSANNVELEPVTLPSDFTGLPNLGALSVGGKDPLTISTGNYCYESISVPGKAVLILDDNTHIYVITNFSVSGQAVVYTNSGVEIYIGQNGSFAGQGIVNKTGVPNNLRIFGLGPGSSLSYTGLSDFYGTIYAPESTLYMAGNAACYGALVGDDVTLAGNIQFHYDESLADNGPFSGYDIAYWQED